VPRKKKLQLSCSCNARRTTGGGKGTTTLGDHLKRLTVGRTGWVNFDEGDQGRQTKRTNRRGGGPKEAAFRGAWGWGRRKREKKTDLVFNRANLSKKGPEGEKDNPWGVGEKKNKTTGC